MELTDELMDPCNNKSNVKAEGNMSATSVAEVDLYVSTESLKVMLIIVPIIIIPLFCLLGSVGNLLSLAVLCNKRMHSQTNSILSALCISDTLFLAHSLLFTAINLFRKMDPIEGERFRSHMYPFFGAYGSVVTARITSCLTMLLCAERFIAVYFPMQARIICTIKSTRIAIFVIYLTSALVFIPFFFKYESVTSRINENETRTTLNKTEFYTNNMKFYSAYGTILNVIFRITPLCIIFILNFLMIHAVHRTWKSRQSMSSLKETHSSLRLSSRGHRRGFSDQNHITIMLVIVAFVFLICILPGAVLSIATHIWPQYSPFGKNRNLYICISTITFLLETINSSVNFIIYMAFSRKFRLLYKEKFCCGHGQYYSKISTSMREKFRWSTTRKNGKQDSDSFGRRTVSDIGPLIGGYSSSQRGKRYSAETHSDGCELHLGRARNQQEMEADFPDMIRTHHRGHYLKHLHTRSLRNLFALGGKRQSDTSNNGGINGNGFKCNSEVCQQLNGHFQPRGTDV